MKLRGPLDRLAALDPTGAVGHRFVSAARRVPGVTVGERQLQRLEDAVLRELGRRLDEARGEPAQLPRRTRAAAAGAAGNGEVTDALGHTPAELMESLLQQSIEQTPDDGERSLAEKMLRELVPDEARILAALSDGTEYVLVDIVARGGPERGKPILAGASNVGRRAGVVLPEQVPVYVSHLLTLGLARRGPENESLADEYAILLTDPAVIHARESSSGLRPPRVLRSTVAISQLGAVVWKATHGGVA